MGWNKLLESISSLKKILARKQGQLREGKALYSRAFEQNQRKPNSIDKATLKQAEKTIEQLERHIEALKKRIESLEQE